ncbi:DUF2269 domain-containing protein [Nocardia noduli]|uniref:DUF2269 domain-containing protein n=1 Tax=Nocardia noduli TaxID=2815722 RepID=UPI0027DEC673|nr:DUF2269 domain-containing protein [Nocardia noduli]
MGASVGWLGAVVTFLVMAVAGVGTADVELVRAVDLIAPLLVRWVLVPLAFATLVTGVVVSVATPWGLLRHYWVLFKLLLTLVATVVLLLYTRTAQVYGDLAMRPDTPLEALRAPTFVVHASLAVMILVAAMILAMYKPRGLTPRGLRQRREHAAAAQS